MVGEEVRHVVLQAMAPTGRSGARCSPRPWRKVIIFPIGIR